MIYRNIYNLFFLLCVLPSLVTEDYKLPTDYILCRQCGTDVAGADAIINLRSPAAVSRFNESLFGLHQVLVQELVNPLGIKFKVISVLESYCITTAKNWVIEHSWFPGYAWKPCICSRCKKHIGWVFEPLELADSLKIRASNKGFYTLILDSLISEFDSDGLLLVPQTLSIR